MDRHLSLKRCLSIFFRCLSVIVCLLFPVFDRCRIELCLEAAGEVAGGAEAQQIGDLCDLEILAAY